MALGQKTGGRVKGGHSTNKASRAREAWYAKHGIMPIDYMLQVLRDEDETQERRMWAAQTAAPYVHPRLAAIAVGGAGDDGVHAWLVAAQKLIEGSDPNLIEGQARDVTGEEEL